MHSLLLALLLHVSPAPGIAAHQEEDAFDLVVYGGTSAGVAAAVQASRMGATVVVVSPSLHLGGLSSSGLGFTDTGNKAVIGGLAREFYHRVWRHYQEPEAWVWQTRDAFGGRGQGTPAIDGEARTMWLFEPHVAEGIFEAWIEEEGIPVLRDEWLDREAGVVVEDGRLQSFRTLSGRVFRGRMFVDATYEGDLMAAAGVPFTVGRESNELYGETLNGAQPERATSHQFPPETDPYRVPGEPASGLLPRIDSNPPDAVGTGDARIQAYNYRVCLTRVPENRVPFSEPEGYDADEYELLLRTLLAGSRHYRGKFDAIPGGKTDTNNSGGFSTDNIGYNHDYPTADYERRKEILRKHELYQRGYYWFLVSDPRVPAEVREWMGAWGLARDEFEDNDHWPHQIYVREARRMVSDFVVTERHVRGLVPTPRSVGMGSYNMDSHHTRRYVGKDGFVRNEGDIQVNPGGPYPIDYGAIVPPVGSCTNLLVPVCLSASHIAFGSIRMEPVFLILGQSAATAALLSLREDQPLQDLDYELLREHLEEAGQVLRLESER